MFLSFFSPSHVCLEETLRVLAGLGQGVQNQLSDALLRCQVSGRLSSRGARAHAALVEYERLRAADGDQRSERHDDGPRPALAGLHGCDVSPRMVFATRIFTVLVQQRLRPSLIRKNKNKNNNNKTKTKQKSLRKPRLSVFGCSSVTCLTKSAE